MFSSVDINEHFFQMYTLSYQWYLMMYCGIQSLSDQPYCYINNTHIILILVRKIKITHQVKNKHNECMVLLNSLQVQ